MGKDIVLPWSCNTNDLIKSLLFKAVLILAPMALVFTFIEIVHPIVPIMQVADYLVSLLIVGLLGTMFSWMYQIHHWDEEGSLPSFRCKCDNDNFTERSSE